MRILKYFLLLFLLLFIGAAVFLSTQNAEYDVSKSKIIKTPASTIYTYVNDYRNWESFYSKINATPFLEYSYPSNSNQKNASFSWNGSINGTLQTKFAKENDSLAILNFENDQNNSISIKFKDTLGGTKVTWNSKGNLSFKSKILSFFNGGTTSVVTNEIEKSLQNLDKILNYELNTFSININGIVHTKETFYLKQSIVSREKNVSKNIKILIPRMLRFVSKNKIETNGKPFVLYHKYDKINDLISLSVCMPVRDSVFISAGSDMQAGKINSFLNVKSTLLGDYKHLQKTWKKSEEYISKNKLQQNISVPIMEVYSKNNSDFKSPSKFITEVYIPIFYKIEKPIPTFKKVIDSAAIKTDEVTSQSSDKP